MILLSRRQLVELDDFKAKQIGHVMRVAGIRGKVIFVYQLGNLLVHAAIDPLRMRQDGAVKLFRPETWLPPAEKQNRRRASRNQLISEHAQDAGAHERIYILPAYVARLLFHDPESLVTVRRAD